ncbi:MAG: DUF4350 domain-containing protein [Bacteroidota bacterium]
MRDFKIYIIIASLLLLAYVVVLYNKPAPVNWKPTLYYGDKIPFGTYVLYKQLNDIFPAATITNTNKSIASLFSGKIKPGNYFIIAKQVKISKIDFDALTKYVAAGNTVFISTFNWAGYFKKGLKLETREEDNEDKRPLNFTNPLLKQTKNYRFDKDINNQYFSRFDTIRASVIVSNSAGKATYLSYKFGKGTLLLSTNPELFSNYSLLTPQGASYAERALSYLPAKQTLYWDQYQNHDVVADMSPMRVFLNNPNLRWAYYLSLFILFIYILFEGKRRQRIIPVIEPLKNSTVDFVNVVGRVYYERRDNANIAAKKILYLLNYLRETYQLKTNKLDSEFIDNLAHKTGLEVSFARDVVNYINYLGNQQKVTDHELIELNNLIEKFYSQSR